MADARDTSIRILIVDDHTMVRAGLRMLIEQESDLCVVAEAADLDAAVQLAVREQPDIILLDLDMGGQSSLEILPDLLASASKARVLVLTGVRDARAHRDAVRRGTVGVVAKEQAAEVLLKAIRKVHAGEPWLDRMTMGHVLAEMRTDNPCLEADHETAKIATLSNREREVLDLVSQGFKNHEIGERLFISDHTVRHHLAALFAKLNVSGRLELILYAYRHGLATPPGDPGSVVTISTASRRQLHRVK